MITGMDITRLFPHFLLRDRNGYALARAIEAAMQYMRERIETGLAILTDPDQMPEWRLDEMAWEKNCLYDYHGTIDQKRYWIRAADRLNRDWGLPQAIYNYLEGYFDTVQVEENWEYGGDPYHFRVFVTGQTGMESLRWAQKAIERVKNVRSTLDSVTIGSTAGIVLSADMDVFFVDVLRAHDEQWANANDIAPWDTFDPEDWLAYTDQAKTDENVTGE